MNKSWWKETVVYQIYPISYKDSNGDGIGDLKGIIEKLDYIKDLGVETLWISPYFQSPYVDNGYDISDYRSIDPKFGTMDDWEELLKGIHDRGLKLIMDLVVNHCSNQHMWFKEALKGKDNPYRDYFIWKEPSEDGGYPNNWGSFFGGSAWTFDEKSGQYYLHLFSKEQPDLNWENPKLRQEIYDIMTFWAEKGVDGFRLDVINAYGKTKGLPDGHGNQREGMPVGFEHFDSIDATHSYVKEMNEQVFSKYDLMTVGEAGGVSIDDALKYTRPEEKEVSLVFQFDHVDVSCQVENGLMKPTAPTLPVKKALIKWQKGLAGKGWNSLYLSNHDQPRQVSKYGNDSDYRVESAKLLATLIHLQQGTPFIYQGEELGMTNIKVTDIEEVNDIQTKGFYYEGIKKGKETPKQLLAQANACNRDNSRTPMQWNGEEGGGFSAGQPWMNLNKNYEEINVDNQDKDPESILNYYRKLNGLRKKYDVAVYGSFNVLEQYNENLFVFLREYEEKQLLVVLNMSVDEIDFSVPKELKETECQVYIANYKDVTKLKDCRLRPYEAQVFLLEK